MPQKKKLSSKVKQLIIYIATILFSLIYIIVGNHICKTTLYDQSMETYQTESAVVTRIRDVDLQKYSIGLDEEDESSMVTEKTIFFDAYIKRTEETVFAIQTIDSMHPVNPKDVEEGDKVLLNYLTLTSDTPEWVFAEYQRSDTLIWLGVVFLALLLLFGRKKGVNTIVSLAFTCLAIFAVFVPSILSGYNIYVMSLITCLFIIVMTLLVINGASKKTFCSAMGCLGGLAVTGVLTRILDQILNLTGAVDEDAVFLLLLNENNPIDLRAIIFGAIIIGALGATMDISMSISSSLQEVGENMVQPNFRQLVKSGFNIGRDIMGTMANTLILAYIGSSLSLVLLLIANAGSLLNLFNREMIVVEVMQALVGSLGILFTIPITTFLCASVYSRKSKQSHSNDQNEKIVENAQI